MADPIGDHERMLTTRSGCLLALWIALATSGCVRQSRGSMDVPTPPDVHRVRSDEPGFEEADPLSRLITTSISTLLGANLADRDAVGEVLGGRWKAGESFGLASVAASGRSGPFVEVWLEFDQGSPRASLTLTLDAHCYDGRGLIHGFAPGGVEQPYAMADGDLRGIVGRGYFDTSGKRVLLAYRQGESKQCVTEIVLRQPAGG